jgi:hypothetical protein
MVVAACCMQPIVVPMPGCSYIPLPRTHHPPHLRPTPPISPPCSTSTWLRGSSPDAGRLSRRCKPHHAQRLSVC